MNFRNVFILLLVFAAGFIVSLLQRGCGETGSLQTRDFDSSRNKHGQQITQQQVSEIMASEMKRLYDTIDGLKSLIKNPEYVIRYQSTTDVNNVNIHYKDSLQIRYAYGPDTPCLLLPQQIEKKERWYQFWATIAEDGLWIDTMRMFNEQSIILSRGHGVFRKPYIATVHNANPFVKTTGMTSYKSAKKEPTLAGKIISGTIFFGLGFIAGKI